MGQNGEHQVGGLSASGRDLLGILLGESAADYELIDEWTSRTSKFFRFRAASSTDLVLKICEGWTVADAQTSFESARRLTAVPVVQGVRSLEFIAWSAHPPALLSEYVSGEELSTSLSKERDDAILSNRISAIGAFLGHAHRLPIPSEAQTKPPDLNPRRPVLSAGDFATYNFRVDANGMLVYLEPPSKARRVSAYRDLARFYSSIAVHLRGRGQLLRILRRCLLDAYRAAEGSDWGWRDHFRLFVYILRGHRARRARRRRHSQLELS